MSNTALLKFSSLRKLLLFNLACSLEQKLKTRIKVKRLFFCSRAAAKRFLEWFAVIAIHRIPNRTLQIVGKFPSAKVSRVCCVFNLFYFFIVSPISVIQFQTLVAKRLSVCSFVCLFQRRRIIFLRLVIIDIPKFSFSKHSWE